MRTQRTLRGSSITFATSERPLKILGIAGGTASGKSTLARALSEAFGPRAVLLSHDRYYRSLPEAYRGHELDYNFDHPDALDNERLISDMLSLQRGESIDLVNYDFAGCVRTPPDTWDHVEPAEILIVEGILVLSLERLRAQFDYSVFVDTPADIRLGRRLVRDIAERGDTLESVLDQYLATVRPMHEVVVQPSKDFADLIVDGQRPLEGSVHLLQELLR